MVVELERDLKRRLYTSLAAEGRTFKDWLIDQAERYISDRQQPQLFTREPRATSYQDAPAEVPEIDQPREKHR